LLKRALKVVVLGALGGGLAYGAYILFFLPGGLRAYRAKRTDFKQLYVYGVGERFVDIDFTGLDGKVIRLLEYPHKVVLVNFFTSWSGQSGAEAPRLEKISETYRDSGLQVIGVDVNETAEKARGYLQDHHLTFPAVLVANKVEGGFVVPFYLLIDDGGVVRFAGSGGQPHEMENVITALLGDGATKLNIP
jgi:thiol-disulfide isomerase/thioredoxin